MYFSVAKTSEGARKAWETRKKNMQATKQPDPRPTTLDKVYQQVSNKAKGVVSKPGAPIEPRKDKLPQGKAGAPARAAMKSYMMPFVAKIKDTNERAYINDRVKQMIAGKDRPAGLSGKHGLTKGRAVALEAVTYKVWLAGRRKHNV